jgi:surface carbohydrate biosynthesis protein
LNQSSNRWVYVLVEVAKRELDSRALIAIELAQKGINVVFGEKNHILWNCCLGIYPPGVIFDKCAQIVDNRKWAILKRKGFVFTSLDEEGLVTQPDYFFAERFSEKAADESSVTFCWGKKQADMIRSKYPQAKLMESGNPRMSLLHNDYRTWFQEEIDEIKKKYGDFVLVCSSFNPFKGTYDDSNAWRKKEDEVSKRKVLDICRKIADSGKKIVYRPHPSDAPFKIEDMEVDGRWSIAPWVQSCSLLLNANCGTSFDAYVANTPCITPSGSCREYSFRFANAFARKVHNVDAQWDDDDFKTSQNFLLKRIADHNVANLDSPEKPIDLIAEKLESLSFQVSKTFSSIPFYKLYQFRNRLRFFLTNRSYEQITGKYPKDEFSRIETRLKNLNLSVQKFGNVLKISN